MKILVVEDEAGIREALGKKLERNNHTVILKESGLEGLRAFHQEHPDLAILDIVMPGGMDGLTVCRRIREVSDIPIMLLSAQAITEQDIVEGLNAGADEYLIKPIRLNEFVARVSAIQRRLRSNQTQNANSFYNDGYFS